MSSNLVYSTDKGRIRKNSNKSDQKIISQTSKSSQTGNQHILLKRETKGRKGSGVTLIENLLLDHIFHLNDLQLHLWWYCGQ